MAIKMNIMLLVLVAVIASLTSAAPQLVVPSEIFSTTTTPDSSTPRQHRLAKRTKAAAPALRATYFALPAGTPAVHPRDLARTLNTDIEPYNPAPEELEELEQQYQSHFHGDRRGLTAITTDNWKTKKPHNTLSWWQQLPESTLLVPARLSEPVKSPWASPTPKRINAGVPLEIKPSSIPQTWTTSMHSPMLIFPTKTKRSLPYRSTARPQVDPEVTLTYLATQTFTRKSYTKSFTLISRDMDGMAELGKQVLGDVAVDVVDRMEEEQLKQLAVDVVEELDDGELKHLAVDLVQEMDEEELKGLAVDHVEGMQEEELKDLASDLVEEHPEMLL